MPEREHHRNLASHGMSNDVDRTIGREITLQLCCDGIGHADIAEGVSPCRFTVVGQVDEQALRFWQQAARDGREVLAAAEEPVQKDDSMRRGIGRRASCRSNCVDVDEGGMQRRCVLAGHASTLPGTGSTSDRVRQERSLRRLTHTKMPT